MRVKVRVEEYRYYDIPMSEYFGVLEDYKNGDYGDYVGDDDINEVFNESEDGVCHWVLKQHIDESYDVCNDIYVNDDYIDDIKLSSQEIRMLKLKKLDNVSERVA